MVRANPCEHVLEHVPHRAFRQAAKSIDDHAVRLDHSHEFLDGRAGIVERLNRALRVVVETDDVKQRILAEGGDPLSSTPDDYARDIDKEETKWGTLVRKLNLKVE